ncbi:hypothetical protein [Thalassotalea mangrovi]|uniref:Uncharacterized protein n=1 Tax=Thalassotalea mangrovi TaxID=2572245 RepID=A0A4V5NUG0_9GAMM|nr:hypothetical protein [Thalassotalea mangrovi]TKB46269.1 hypothetical protein E8M12_04245 [Thalassotalea mangrovi]
MSFWKELFDIYQHKLQSRRLASGAGRALVQEMKTNLCLLAEALDSPNDSPDLIASLSDSAFMYYCQQGYDFNTFNQQKLTVSTTREIREFNQYLSQSTEDLVYRAYQRIRVLKAFAKSQNAIKSQRRIQSLLRYHIMLIAHIQGQSLSTSN